VDLRPLLSLCPAVTHLVLSSFAAFHPACTFLLVKWLDSWAEFIHGELPTAPALPAVFPSLEGVRLIDKTLDGAEHGAARTGERRPRRRGAQVVESLAAADRGPRCAVAQVLTFPRNALMRPWSYKQITRCTAM
jgi:hypothetical protein